MALMERVATLIRANLNDLIVQAEDPEKMLRQVIVDMQNQLRQVKTQVAIAITDQHLLAKKQKEHESQAAEWFRKAELAISKEQDELARPALEKALHFRATAEGFEKQLRHQSEEVENLKSVLERLQQKLSEAQAKSDILAAQHRRAKALERAGDARMRVENGSNEMTIDRARNKIADAEAAGLAKSELASQSLHDRITALEKQDQIEQLLADLKANRLTKKMP
ncbi:MAG: PspA/IM30 family protein [Acidobacteriaceae bacterium]|nr:PspA/IM30 family protein [Acidobacteriaceae bacterium]